MMTNIRRLAAATGMALSGAMLASCGSIGTIDVVDGPLRLPVAAGAETQVTIVQVTAYATGWVEAPADILIDQSEPSLPDELRKPQWVPSIAYSVTHPDHGTIILDAGLRSGPCDYGLWPIYWVPCRNEPGHDLVSQLRAGGIGASDILYVIPSHFHGDYISGLADLIDYSRAPVLMTGETLAEIRSGMRSLNGIPTEMLSADMTVQIVDDAFAASPNGERSLDLFGDGSLRLLLTPGHMDGHFSAIARGKERDVLLTFDASHLKANLELTVPSGSVSSRDEAVQSLEWIMRLSQSDDTLVVFGHEPSQWECFTGAIRLDLEVGLCG